MLNSIVKLSYGQALGTSSCIFPLILGKLALFYYHLSPIMLCDSASDQNFSDSRDKFLKTTERPLFSSFILGRAVAS